METKSANIGITKVEIVTFTMTNEALKYKNGEIFGFDISMSFNSPTKNDIFSMTLDIDVVKDQQKPVKLAKLKIKNTFLIKNFEAFLHPPKIQGGQPEIDGGLIVYCLDLSISTARGAWSAKTEGTPLESIVLPIIPANSVMPELAKQAEIMRK